jgi:hypothetical protein
MELAAGLAIAHRAGNALAFGNGVDAIGGLQLQGGAALAKTKSSKQDVDVFVDGAALKTRRKNQ